MAKSLIIDDQKLMQLAMNLDPDPIIAELGVRMSGTPAEGSVLGENPYSMMLGGSNPTATTPAPQTPPGTAAPLDPRSAMALNSMMPQPQKPQFMGAPGLPGRGTPVTIQIPDISNLVKVNLGPQNAQAPVPSLANIIGGRS